MMEVSSKNKTSLKLDRKVARLEDYGVSTKVAFMNEKPLSALPEYFDPWWNIASRLPELVQDGTLRCEVIKMPHLDYKQLNGESEWRLAHVVLCAIAQCYVWMAGDRHILPSIPACLAVPYCEVSKLLDVSPCCSEFNSVQENWRLIHPDGPMTADNMTPIVQLPGGEDQVWFFVVTGQVEKDAAPALCGIVEAQLAVKDLDVQMYIAALEKVEKAIRKMKESLLRMRERCRPWEFYLNLRPYLAGWNSAPFREKGWKGLIYEGVSSEPLCFGGGSAGQSPILQCLDAALAITHQPTEAKICKDYQKKMLASYRGFIQALADGPSIRHFATFAKDPKAVEVYNACLQALVSFRSAHMVIVAEYIIVPSRKLAKEDFRNTYDEPTGLGTGTTGFMGFLKGLRSSVMDTFYPVNEGTEIN